MDRIKAYVEGVESAQAPQQLMEAIAKLLTGNPKSEPELVSIHVGQVAPRELNLSEEEQRSLKNLLEQYKTGEPIAYVGVHVLLMRVMLLRIHQILDTFDQSPAR